MIINDLDLISVAFMPFEADPILPVDTDAELTLPAAFEFLEPASQHRQISKAGRRIENCENFFRTVLDRLKLPAELQSKYLLRLLVPAGSDHLLSIRRPAYYAMCIARADATLELSMNPLLEITFRVPFDKIQASDVEPAIDELLIRRPTKRWKTPSPRRTPSTPSTP